MTGCRRDKTSALLRIARRQHGAATARQAIACGFSHSAIARAVDNRDWMLVHRGIYVVDPAAEPIRAAMFGHVLRARGRTWVSHESAAWLWGIAESVPLRPHLVTTADLRGGRATVRRLACMPADDVAVLRSMPVTSPARTIVDLAGESSPRELEGLVVKALRTNAVSLSALRACAASLSGRGRSGPRALTRLLDAWGPAAPPESVLESKLLGVLRSAGLPAPVAQFEVALPGRTSARLDFAYPDRMVAIEADGYRWHGDAASWRSDLARRNQLTQLGWRTLHFTWHDVTSRPDHVVETVRSALHLRA